MNYRLNSLYIFREKKNQAKFMRYVLLLLLGLIVLSTSIAQNIKRDYIKTPIFENDLHKGQRPTYFDGENYYVINFSTSTNKASVYNLYKFNLTNNSLAIYPINIPNKFKAVIGDLLIHDNKLYVSTFDKLIQLELDPFNRYNVVNVTKVKHSVRDLYWVDNKIVSEDYYDYHPLDQAKKHVRQIIDPITLQVEKVFFLDDISAATTKYSAQLYDIYGTKSLCVRSKELKVLLGKFDSETYPDTIQIPHKMSEQGQEYISKAVYLSENQILLCVEKSENNPLQKRLVLLNKNENNWDISLDKVIPYKIEDSNLLPYERLGFLFTSYVRLNTQNNRLVYLNHSPEYKNHSDKTFAWIEVVEFEN